MCCLINFTIIIIDIHNLLTSDKPYGQATVVPEDVTVAVGGQVSLTCHAPSESSHPTASWFMWSKDNSNFSSNTTDSLRLTPTEVTESGKYRCAGRQLYWREWPVRLDHSDSTRWVTVTVQVEWLWQCKVNDCDSTRWVTVTVQGEWLRQCKMSDCDSASWVTVTVQGEWLWQCKVSDCDSARRVTETVQDAWLWQCKVSGCDSASEWLWAVHGEWLWQCKVSDCDSARWVTV